MRASIVFLALLASVASAFAIPVGESIGGLDKRVNTMAGSSGGLTKRGGPEVCTNNMDGTGGTNYQVTKDCCAAVHQDAFFSELFRQCWPDSGPPGNSIDTGAMVQCCTSRGTGSHAV